MPNKHNKHKREELISIVITIAFILGFILIANEAAITGLTTVEFEFRTSVLSGIDYSGFESGEQGWTFGGGTTGNRIDTMSNVTDTGTTGGTWSAHIEDDVAGSYFSKAFVFSGNDTVNLSFSYYPESIDNNEYFQVFCDATEIFRFTDGDHAEDAWFGTTVVIYPANCTFADATIKFDGTGGFSKTDDDVWVDGINLTGYSEPLDETAPKVDLVWPSNTTNSTLRFLNFTYNATDANTVDDCILWLSKSPGVWELNKTDTGIEEEVNQSFNITVDDQSMLWKVECNDTSTNNRGNSSIFNITVDVTPPIVNITLPRNNTNWTTSDINFTYNVSDGFLGVDSCVLWLKKGATWELNKTDKTITEVINQSINITVDEQNMLWLVECNDTWNNRGNSTTFNISIDSTPPSVNITLPRNNTNWTTHYINFTYNTSDNLLSIDSCVLWLKKGATWQLNFTDTSIASVINQSINRTMDDGCTKWRIECNDTLNNRGNSTTFNISIDSTPPSVNITLPRNNTNWTTKYINFTYNTSDGCGIDSCILWLWKNSVWELNFTDTSITSIINQSINRTIDDQTSLWRVECNTSTFNNRGNSTTFNITVDTSPPFTNLQAPVNNTNSTTKYLNFTYNVTDNLLDIDSCILWLYKSGSWERNLTNSSVTETINQTFNITVDNQNMLWKVECNDTLNNRDNSSIYNITVDTTVPFVQIWAPVNTTNSTTEYINFTYNVTDNLLDIDSCILWLYKGGTWQLNSTDPSIEETINQTINITVDDQGMMWRVECNDTLNNRGNSSIFNITVDSNDPPTLNISSPNNNSYSLSHSVNFTYNVTDTDKFGTTGNVVNCTLLYQKGGSWIYNKSNATTIQEGINQTINITLEHSNINWTIECRDAMNERVNATEGYFNYTVLNSTVSITLVWPGNNTYQNGFKSVNLTYNVTSKDSSITCDLYINNTWNATDTDIERDVNQTFNLTFSTYQKFNWTVGCNNSFNEYVNSTMYNYSLLEVAAVAPKIPVANITVIQNQDVAAGTYKAINFTFIACDQDQQNSDLTAYGNYTGESDFYDSNLTCLRTGWTNTTCAKFNCSFNIWSWYTPGSWNFSFNVTDGEYWAHSNGSTWDLGTTTAMIIYPTSINWTSLTRDTWNQTASGDPISINNTGNYNVSFGNVNITGYDLKGEDTKTEYIPGANFTVNLATSATFKGECGNWTDNGTAIINATSTNIGGSMLPRGNFSVNDGSTGQEQLYFCLRHVPPSKMISDQSYSTDAFNPAVQWVIGISS